jgi:hypothetical protein
MREYTRLLSFSVQRRRRTMIFEQSIALRWRAALSPLAGFLRVALMPSAALQDARALFRTLSASDETPPPDPFSSETPFLTDDWPR